MPGVYVVTDSASDLTPEEVAPFDVEIVPLTVRFGSEEFTDGVDLSIDDFYRRMADSEELPQTAVTDAPSALAICTAIGRQAAFLIKNGAYAVILISICYCRR